MARTPQSTPSTGGKPGRGKKPVAAEPAEDILYVQSVEKAFRVLAAFGSGRRTLSLAEIATQTGFDRSTAQRFAHTVEKLGYLHKDPRTRRYELTVRTLELGAIYLRDSVLVNGALPYLIELSRRTEEAVSLAVLDGAEIVYVSRLISRHTLHANVVIGSRLPAYCTAPGMAMLSRLESARIKALLDASDIRAFTPATVTRRAELLDRIASAARLGYATASEQIYVNDIAIAAPVTGGQGEPIAAVSVAVSKLRCSLEVAVERYAHMVTGAAAAMSHSLPMN